MSRPPDDSRSVAAALAAAGRLLRDHPAAVLPAYLLALGVTGAARVPLIVGLGVAGAFLAATGRLEPLVRAAADLQEAARETGDASGVGGRSGPGSVMGVGGEIPAGLDEAVANAVTPTVVASVVLGVVGAVIVGALARAVASAVTYGTVWAGLDGRAPLVTGVRAAGRWRTFLGIILARTAIVLLALGIPVAVGGVAATALGGVGDASGTGGVGTVNATTALAILVVLAVAGLGLLLALLVWFLLAFAESAAIVDDLRARGALRASPGFVRDHPAHSLGFALVALGGYVAVGIGVSIANAAGAGRLGGLVLPLVVAPLLDTGATALYAGVDGSATADRAGADRASATARVRRTLGLGWSEFVGFLRSHPLSVVGAVGVLAAGIALGYATTASYGVTVPPPGDVSNVFGAVAVGPFLTIAANNWLVSAGLAYGGVAFGLPAVTGLLFNGVLVGALAGVFDRTAFLALVAPHGVLELPVIAVAGGLGLHLGVVGWRGVRGRADAAEVAGELERAAYVLVGIGLLLVVAAAIEAFLTPRIAAAVLG